MNHNYGNEYTFTLRHDNGAARVVLFQPFSPDRAATRDPPSTRR